MKAEELRVGNWVCVNHAFKKKSEVKDYSMLTRINGLGNGFISWDKSYGFYHRGIFPIPTTDEWLVKFGFELHYGRYYKGNFCYYPDLKMFEWRGIPLLDSLWNEVHKLQNLHFALTGQELTIK
jgi:hypothetical protein